MQAQTIYRRLDTVILGSAWRACNPHGILPVALPLLRHTTNNDILPIRLVSEFREDLPEIS